MKRRIAIIAGGDSGEFEVSVASAGIVRKHLDPGLFKPYLILMKGMDWMYEAEDGSKVPVDKNDFSITLGGEKITFDCVFNAIHGTPGEDGRIQGYLEMLDLPHTSCDLITSALTFDKHFCNGFVRQLGVKTTKSIRLVRGEHADPAKIAAETGIPCFVKPNAGGSSVGITKVTDPSQLEAAIERAFREDDEVLVEKFIEGTEITCGVIGTRAKMIALPITEIVSKNEFFDYEAKYHGKADEITPARVSEDISEECKDLSLRLYRELKCKGAVRFDYIFNDDGMYFLEVNTVPGLSEASIVPQQAAEAGISLTQLFTMMIEAAKES